MSTKQLKTVKNNWGTSIRHCETLVKTTNDNKTQQQKLLNATKK